MLSLGLDKKKGQAVVNLDFLGPRFGKCQKAMVGRNMLDTIVRESVLNLFHDGCTIASNEKYNHATSPQIILRLT